MDAISLLFPSQPLELKSLDQPWWVTPSHALLPGSLNRVVSCLTSTESEDGSDESLSSGDFSRLELIPPECAPSNVSPRAPPGLTKPDCLIPLPTGLLGGTRLLDAKPMPPPMNEGERKRRCFNFAVVFHGYDLEKHAEFELVPRLIGRRGCNMAPIYQTGAGARVRGRGSGYKEVKTPDGEFEKDETLRLAVSCRTSFGCKTRDTSRWS